MGADDLPATADDSFDFGANAEPVAPGVTAPTATPADLPPVATTEEKEIVREVPNPEILALTKRALGQIAKGYRSDNAITQEQAQTALPLLDQLRRELHGASPAWKEADAYYANAMNFRDAYTKAFGAQQKATAGGLDPAKLKTPEAISAWVAKAAGTPIGASRAAGQQLGTKARLADALRNAPLEPTIGETVARAGAAFEPSAAAAKIRRPAFGSDAEAASFGQALGEAQSKTRGDFGPPEINLGYNPMRWLGAVRALSKPNALATAEGMRLRQELATAMADPRQVQAIRRAMELAKQGEGQLQNATKAQLVLIDRLLKAGFRPDAGMEAQ
jgi:hypothetical protein